MPYILIIFQENVKVAIFTENRVRGEPLKKDFMGRDSLLEDREILTGREAHKASAQLTTQHCSLGPHCAAPPAMQNTSTGPKAAWYNVASN